MKTVAEALFYSRIRDGISVYLKPRITNEDAVNSSIHKLQVLQNDMLRLIGNKTKNQHTNMSRLREELKLMSVN